MSEKNVTPEKKPSPFAGMKEQKGLKAKIKFFFDVLEKYPDVRQMVLFMLFSLLCGAGQLATTYILQYTVVYAPGMDTPFNRVNLGDFYLFQYDTTAAFIGFLCGATVGQVLTFILNRKKTFRATNNVVVSAIMYAVMAVIITLLQALIGGWITVACQKANPVDKSSFLYFIYTLTGLAVGGITALVLSFLGNKFLVMRDWGSKKSGAVENATETVAESDEQTEEEEMPAAVEETAEEVAFEEGTEEAVEEVAATEESSEEAKAEEETESVEPAAVENNEE